jgi:DNA-binding LacI/PurR family transcriptional regulator
VVAESDVTEDAGYRGAARLLRGGRAIAPVAAVNDLAAVGAMSAVADAGLGVPGDFAITGYDDTFVSAIRQVSLISVNPDSSASDPSPRNACSNGSRSPNDPRRSTCWRRG